MNIVAGYVLFNPDIERFDLGWEMDNIGNRLGFQNQQYENGNVSVDNYIEAYQARIDLIK